MRASIPNTEQLEMSENNDIKRRKRQSMRLAMWKYLRRQDTKTQGIGIEEKRNGNPLSGKPTLFQQEEEESNTDEREKKEGFQPKIYDWQDTIIPVQDSKGKNYHPTRVNFQTAASKFECIHAAWYDSSECRKRG